MKKIFAIILAVMLILTAQAFAEDMDLSTFTDAELEGLQTAIVNEQAARKAAAEEAASKPLERGSAGDDVRAIQSRLKALGYYDGSIDGSFGPRTERAIKAFEVINGYGEDGKLAKGEKNWLLSEKALAAVALDDAVTAPNGLPGIQVSANGNFTDDEEQQWLCDEINQDDGTFSCKVGEIVLDGSVPPTQVREGSTIFYVEVYNMVKAANYTEKIASTLPVQPTLNFDEGIAAISGYVDENETYADRNWIYFSNGESSSVEEMTEWLKENPLVIVYEFAKPMNGNLIDDLATLYNR